MYRSGRPPGVAWQRCHKLAVFVAAPLCIPARIHPATRPEPSYCAAHGLVNRSRSVPRSVRRSFGEGMLLPKIQAVFVEQRRNTSNFHNPAFTAPAKDCYTGERGNVEDRTPIIIAARHRPGSLVGFPGLALRLPPAGSQRRFGFSLGHSPISGMSPILITSSRRSQRWR